MQPLLVVDALGLPDVFLEPSEQQCALFEYSDFDIPLLGCPDAVRINKEEADLQRITQPCDVDGEIYRFAQKHQWRPLVLAPQTHLAWLKAHALTLWFFNNRVELFSPLRGHVSVFHNMVAHSHNKLKGWLDVNDVHWQKTIHPGITSDPDSSILLRTEHRVLVKDEWRAHGEVAKLSWHIRRCNYEPFPRVQHDDNSVPPAIVGFSETYRYFCAQANANRCKFVYYNANILHGIKGSPFCFRLNLTYTEMNIRLCAWNGMIHSVDNRDSALDEFCADCRTKMWARFGLLHSVGDVPAVIHFSEEQELEKVWYCNGRLHRRNYLQSAIATYERAMKMTKIERSHELKHILQEAPATAAVVTYGIVRKPVVEPDSAISLCTKPDQIFARAMMYIYLTAKGIDIKHISAGQYMYQPQKFEWWNNGVHRNVADEENDAGPVIVSRANQIDDSFGLMWRDKQSPSRKGITDENVNMSQPGLADTQTDIFNPDPYRDRYYGFRTKLMYVEL